MGSTGRAWEEEDPGHALGVIRARAALPESLFERKGQEHMYYYFGHVIEKLSKM